MFFNSSVFVNTWYWSWIWLVFVLGLKCASHLHKCCPNQECQCSYLTPIKRPDSALHPCQSSLRYNYLQLLSTIQTWIDFARFFLEFILLLLSEYFADKTLELFHRPKPKHEKSLSQYWLCKYCLPNKLDRPRINIEFFSYTTLWRASPLISCGSSPHFWGSFQTHRATRKKGCISICNVNKMSGHWIKEKEKCWYHIQEWLSLWWLVRSRAKYFLLPRITRSLVWVH